jgi:hypothetical protein
MQYVVKMRQKSAYTDTKKKTATDSERKKKNTGTDTNIAGSLRPHTPTRLLTAQMFSHTAVSICI